MRGAISRFFLAGLAAISMISISFGQSIDITGAWKDDRDSLYCMRQVGNEVFWYMDARGEMHNVYHGIVSDRYISGKWADLPGGELDNSGALAIRIESSELLVKVGQSEDYGGSRWTRTDNIVCASCSAGSGTTGTCTATSTEKEPAPTECPCGLGSQWNLVWDSGNYWAGELNRQGESNLFEARYWTGAASGKGIHEVKVSGKEISMRATDLQGGKPSTWQGTVGDERNCDSSLCCNVNGTWHQDKNPATVYSWKGYMVCSESEDNGSE